ncbi:hypothetical protein KOI40_01970 [Aestuariicella sp. G3-2]|nr:hypothetical protein [Aestuariicella albida]
MNQVSKNSTLSPTEPLYQLSATELQRLLANGDISAVEVMTSFLDRIETVNPKVNAICTLLEREEALALAREADAQRARGEPLGPLHGIPIACKDLARTKGMRTTMGSLACKDMIPDTDSLFVERLRAAGALIIGKTNTPEFGAGSHTFNDVFGTTKNPYNLAKTAGGSSGGAAAALAARMLPIADGSDMGGSLRNPAAFCNVVGFRPSMGRVPMWPSALTWQSRLGLEGPMARDVDDLGLLLSVMAGPDPRDPRSIQQSPAPFASIKALDGTGKRIGWSPDLGMLPVAQEIRDVCASALTAFAEMGCTVEQQHPDMTGAMEVFRTLRASYYAVGCGPLLGQHRHEMKTTLIENTEIGLKLTAPDLLSADQKRSAVYQRMVEFFEEFDYLVLPTTQVAPFDHEQEWVREIDGVAMDDYLDWMSICCVITICDLPAISMPCGFTQDGLPVGLQIVGKPWADMEVLQLAKAFEQRRPFANQEPDLK